MEYQGYLVYNAYQIRGMDIAALEERLGNRFDVLDTESKGWVNAEQTRLVFEEEARALLLPGVDFPAERFDSAFQAETWAELDKDAYITVVEASLQALGEDLKGRLVGAHTTTAAMARVLSSVFPGVETPDAAISSSWLAC